MTSAEIYSVAALTAGEAPASLATIYTAAKQEKAAAQHQNHTVNALKQQFQSQIERKFVPKQQQSSNAKQITKSAIIQTRADREVNAFKQLRREKSFDEARSAVQSQIEKIFQKAAAAKNAADAEIMNKKKSSINADLGPRSLSPTRRFTMHGISHLNPEDEDGQNAAAAAPLHHGITLQVCTYKSVGDNHDMKHSTCVP